MTVLGAGPTLDDLLDSLATMPASQSTVLAVMRMATDPEAGPADVARLCASDPVLTTQLLRVANSAAFGMSSQVTTLQRAVVVMGMSTVRSVAAAAVASATANAGTVRPPASFWVTAAATATGAALLARRVGASRDEAFCVGVLHELGAALLLRVDPDGWPQLVAECMARGESPVIAERERYGVDHAWAAARVLQSWDFPTSLCDAVARHHDASASSLLSPLPAALRAGRALASLVPGTETHDPADLGDAGREALAVAGADDDEAQSLAEQVQAGSADLALALTA